MPVVSKDSDGKGKSLTDEVEPAGNRAGREDHASARSVLQQLRES